MNHGDWTPRAVTANSTRIYLSTRYTPKIPCCSELEDEYNVSNGGGRNPIKVVNIKLFSILLMPEIKSGKISCKHEDLLKAIWAETPESYDSNLPQLQEGGSF